MDNLALKYRPKTFSDVTEQKNVVHILEAMCKQPDLPNRNFLLVGPRGCGKAQPLFSKILTPHGFVYMGDIQIGEKVFTSQGNIGRVSEIYPQGERDIYLITLDDNTSIFVADNHINEVVLYDQTTGKDIDVSVPTLELKAQFDNLRAINPHVNFFGIRCPKVDWEDDDVIVPESEESFYRILKRFDTSYLYSSKETRIKFVKKLFEFYGLGKDTKEDCVPVDSEFEVILHVKSDCDNAQTLQDSICFLFRSLGCKVLVNRIRQELMIFQVSLTKELYFAIFENPDLSKSNEPLRFIKSIMFWDRCNCQCIMIDHEDHTYISDDFIPTHNTTLGRIMANELNDGLGTVIELDAASHNGVDAIRDLMNQAAQYPIGSKYKVFILDECHALSNASWQSMLLTLESQPAKSIFILLTTNPEKIPQTILSRVQKFQLSNISLDGIVKRLKYVIESENSEGREITYDDEALLYIAKLAKGGMRDALTLLDKALVYDSNINSMNLKYSLDIPEYDDYFALLNAYAKKDKQSMIEITSKVYESGTNFVKWFEGFQSFVINIAKYVFVGDINKTMIPSYYADKVAGYTSKHAQICLKLSQVLVDMISKLSRTDYLEEVAISYLCNN